MTKGFCDTHRRMHERDFTQQFKLWPGVLVRVRLTNTQHMQTYNHTRLHTHAHTEVKSEPTALLWTASQDWDKVHSPPLGYQTVAQACIHLWKTWSLFSHTAQLSLYLQMVPLSRNVTFDLVSHTETSIPMKSGRGFFWPSKPDKWAHDCLCGKHWFNTI